jgi:two-component system heavy metal sensor histidine kinase CusS
MKHRKQRSIAWQLSVWYAAASFLLLVFGTGFLYFILKYSFDRDNVEYLTEKARTLQTLLRDRSVQDPTVRWEVQGETVTHPSLRVFSRVLDSAGKVLLETDGMSAALPAEVLSGSPNSDEDLATRELTSKTGITYRVITAPVAGRSNEPEKGSRRIQVAVDISFEDHLLSGYRRQMWFVLGLGLIAAVWIGRTIAVRGLRPLSRISKTISETRSTTLGRRVQIEEVPSEVQELASTFNSMLDRLRDSFERLSQFSSDIAHELRTPLNNLRGEIDLALSKRRTADEYNDLLGSLAEECQELARLIDSLLFLARAEQPAMQIRRDTLNIAKELGLVCEFYEAAAAEKDVRLCVHVPDETTFALDRSLFQRAIGNVVQNAITHTGQGGEVRISAKNGSGELQVLVQDNGAGIAEEHLPRILDRFYRADEARGRDRGGAGLGLAIVESITRLHGGDVTISSQAGAGTTVVLRFRQQ